MKVRDFSEFYYLFLLIHAIRNAIYYQQIKLIHTNRNDAVLSVRLNVWLFGNSKGLGSKFQKCGWFGRKYGT